MRLHPLDALNLQESVYQLKDLKSTSCLLSTHMLPRRFKKTSKFGGGAGGGVMKGLLDFFLIFEIVDIFPLYYLSYIGGNNRRSYPSRV
jgi:hypothetical protein